MKKLFEKHSLTLGLIFTIASALICIALSWLVFLDEEIYRRAVDSLFDCGIDVMGAFTCAALYFGSMKQEGDGARAFRAMNVLVCAGFLVNEVMYLTLGVPELRAANFAMVMSSKLIDLVLIYYFYRYVSITLDFKGKLAGWAEKGIPILLGLEILVILSNIFYPVTFMTGANGEYQATGASAAEDIYLITASIIATILIIRSESPRNQKAAALTFLFLPLINYALTFGEFGNASQYGMVLMSLIIMYCVIFNDKTAKLASTQTELNMATEIQARMLPSNFPALPSREEFDLYASMDPAKEVGGDFYDFFMIDDDHLGIVCADVSGKGVPAALFMMAAKIILANNAMMGLSPAQVLEATNSSVCASNPEEMFITVWFGILEISTGILTAANAGHEYPALKQGNRFELFKDKHGLVLGAMDGVKYTEYTIRLDPGDKIFLYTDGVPEATDSHNKLFGTGRMLEALNRRPEESARNILADVQGAVDEFVGAAEQFDDLTMLCLEYR